MTLAEILILGLAVHRAWRLLAVDELPWLERGRCWLVGMDEPYPSAKYVKRPLLKKWIDCPWCSGLYLTAGGYALWRWGGDAGRIALDVAAASSIVGLIVRNLDPTED